jgi:hypothetical protein
MPSNCLSPLYLEPIPAAIMTKVFFILTGIKN